MKAAICIVSALVASGLGNGAGANQNQSLQPLNLATIARISANSFYSVDYAPENVANGQLPAEFGRDDAKRAWCVDGRTHRSGAELRFAWETPVPLDTVVYYGRTAWFLEECWRGFEIYLDQSATPIASGVLLMRHGPQRIKLPSGLSATNLLLNFASSYGGPNPGASEVQIFSEQPSEAALKRWLRRDDPPVDEVNLPALRSLIDDLERVHGENYHLAPIHRTEADNLAAVDSTVLDVESALAKLQRAVLLFDVDRLLLVQRHEIDSSHVYTYHNEGFRPGGGLYLAQTGTQENPRQLVASPRGQILDCDLSYDGLTVLFSWRQAEGEGYHLWAIGVDGSDLRQLTRGEWHDYNGCWLPDGGIAFVSTRNSQFAYCWNSPVGVVHRMNADGTGVRLLSANYLNDFTPYPLEDGRLIYSRWEYVDKPAIPIQSLWTMNLDGTQLAGYYGNRVISPGTFMEARSIPGTGLIICTMTGHNGPARGAIGVLDRRHGVNAQEAIWNLTPDVPIPEVRQGDGNFWGSKPYSTPVPLDSTRFLVSARGPVLARTLDGKCQATVMEAPANGLQWFCAQPIRQRPLPPLILSNINEEAAGAGLAYMALQDIYHGLEPYVRRGEVKSLRVVRELPKTVRIHPDKRAFGFQFPVISAGATYAGKDVLGEVEVAEDGSAYFEVPAGVPIYFIALDAEGRAVQRMRSFTHLMPGEVQGCVGCHEAREQSTPLLSTARAMLNPPAKLRPPEWGNGGFDFARIVQPVLDTHCGSCHSGPLPKGKVDLSGDATDYFNVAYETLARGRRQWGEAQWDSPFVNWIPTYNGFETNIHEVRPKAWGSHQSPLSKLIISGHPNTKGELRVQMDEASRRRILAWIDLNVPYYGTSETSHPENTGSRRIYPARLDTVLAEVAGRRCASCHQGGKVPRQFWTRIGNPQWNNFLMAPLSRAAGGSGRCGEGIFADQNDPDYRLILETFTPLLKQIAERPRTDMPGSTICSSVNRSCK
jgi:hypothetical protein